MKEYKNFLIDDELNIYNKKTLRKLKPHKGTDGYMQVLYKDENHKTIHERVHVIIGHCFIPNPNNYKYVNHIDSNKTNNNLNNLEWCSNSQNVKHCYDSGKRTHKNNTRIYVIDKNKKYIFKSIREAARFFNLDRHKIARILKGELPENYLKYKFKYVM